MAISFMFYLDSGLTQPLATAAVFSMAADGSTGPVDSILYLGSMTANRRAQAASNPGTDPVVISIEDSAPGSGEPATAVKLALSAVGLDAANPGASLSLGVSQILSGSGNAIPVHIRVEDQTLVVGNYTDLALKTNDLFETTL